MDFGRKLFGIVFFAALGITAFAEQRDVRLMAPPVSPFKFTAAWRPNGAPTETRVIGTVVDIRHVAVANARVQLRNLLSGRVLGQDDANDRGEYEFMIDEAGTYVVEMIVANDQVLALSNAGSIRKYETLSTLIQLPGRWNYASRSMSIPVAATAFFGLGSGASMTSTTIAMAAERDVRPVDVEAISPNK